MGGPKYAIGRGVAAIRHKKGADYYQPLVRAVIEFGLPGLLAQATGSTFPNVPVQQCGGSLVAPLPLSEQQAIAHILGTFDDKSEMNRRMSATLEAMARDALLPKLISGELRVKDADTFRDRVL